MGKIAVVTEKVGINVRGACLLADFPVWCTFRTDLEYIKSIKVPLCYSLCSKAFRHRLARLPLY